jgi:hypothetical protein
MSLSPGRGVVVLLALIAAWFLWPASRPLGALVVLEMKLDAAPRAGDANRPPVILLDPPIRLETDRLDELALLGRCASKDCGAVDPRSRSIMMDKDCKGEQDCKPFKVIENPDLYVAGRVISAADAPDTPQDAPRGGRLFTEADAQSIKREIDARLLGRSLPTRSGDTVTIRRSFAIVVNK